MIAEDDLISRSFLSGFLREYGTCDLVADGPEALDAFLTAWKDKAPYHLICLDITMPRADGMKVLKGIRDLEKQYGVTPENRVKIMITTESAQAGLVRKAFADGCDACVTKPIDTQKLAEGMEKLELAGEKPRDGWSEQARVEAGFNHQFGLAATQRRKITDTFPTIPGGGDAVERSYFKSVCALPDCQLEVIMETGSIIHFDFRSRLNTSRFRRLMDKELFGNVRTDGNCLIFEKAGKMSVIITASEFMDLVLIDRRR